jgi:anti-anti-sigma regulatory factor
MDGATALQGDLDQRVPAESDDLLRVSALPADGRGRAVVLVVGQVDHYTVPLLESCLHTHAGRREVQTLVVDLGGAVLSGPAGPAALTHARRRCQRRGARLVVRGDGRQPLGGRS